MEIYEQKICELKRSLEWVLEGFQVMKRREQYQTKEVHRLVELVNAKTSEVNRLDKRIYTLVLETAEKEMRHQAARQNHRLWVQQIKREFEEKTGRKNVEVAVTRKRLDGYATVGSM